MLIMICVFFRIVKFGINNIIIIIKFLFFVGVKTGLKYLANQLAV